MYWALILEEYDFDIVHKAGRVNPDVDGLNWNPSSNEKDAIGACWHADVDLEIILEWHVVHNIPLYFIGVFWGCTLD